MLIILHCVRDDNFTEDSICVEVIGSEQAQLRTAVQPDWGAVQDFKNSEYRAGEIAAALPVSEEPSACG
jgi:hypothetical protein